jgi:hypothetical protein
MNAKIMIATDCGNAPEKLFLKEFYTALAQGDIDFLIQQTPDHIHWNIAGNTMLTRKNVYLDEV